MMRHLSLTLCALATLAAGCASTPDSHFYAVRATAEPAATTSSSLSVVVGPVSVPALVDRPQIVVTKGPNELHLDEFNRWASPLQDNLARVLAENLVTMLGTPQVGVFGETSSVDADYRVIVEVQTFESYLGEAAVLDAVWTVKPGGDGTAKTGRTKVREPTKGEGYDALTAAHSRAVGQLSRDIADALEAQVHPTP